MRGLIVSPAYGRDYTDPAKALADWGANKDFKVEGMERGGTYINKEDAEKYAPGRPIKIRFDKKRQFQYVGQPIVKDEEV